MKLAVKKEPGFFLGTGYHYMLHPLAMKSDEEAEMWQLMGYIILDVSEDQGKALLEEGRKALSHQIKIAFITDAAERLDNENQRRD